MVPQNETNTTFYSVTYFEVMPANPARSAAVAALKAYGTAVRAQNGFGNIESFEQIGRPGHYLLFEMWQDATAFNQRDFAMQKRFRDALQAIRISDIDSRPYKELNVRSPGITNNQTVYVITHVDSSPSPLTTMILQRLTDGSRREAGNLRFDIYQHTMRANHFTIIEAWRNQRALDEHVIAPHTRQYRDEFGPLAGSPLDERLFQEVNP
jgi:quinol monooxygenase YgiN